MLQLRFGLEDGRSRTLEEVGKEFNVTRERIRQVEAKALRKLRSLSLEQLKEYWVWKEYHELTQSEKLLRAIRGGD